MRQWIVRYRNLIAYLFLTAAVAYALYAVQHQATRQAQAIRQSQVVACNRGNELRTSLQGLFLDTKVLRSYLRDGLITKAQYDRSVAASKSAAKKVGPLNCNALYPPIKK